MSSFDRQGQKAPATPKLSHRKAELPKGGGSIRGTGEKFQSNAVTGTGSYGITVPVTACREGVEPKLGLGYDSGSGNGVFGLGWNLDIPAITRKTGKALPRYADWEESDVFLLSGAEDLVPQGTEATVSETVESVTTTYRVQKYRPRVEGLYAKIERWTNDSSGEVHWRSTTRDNVVSTYGRNASSRICDPDRTWRVYKWFLDKTTDSHGNATVYEYKAENAVNVDVCAHEGGRLTNRSRFANTYIKKIRYGQKVGNAAQFHFTVLFDYGDIDNLLTPETESGWPCRQDAFSDYKSGFDIRTYRLCRRILMCHDIDSMGFQVVRGLELEYDENEVATYLTGVTEVGYRKKVASLDPLTYSYTTKSFPEVKFAYTQATIDGQVRRVDLASLKNLPMGLGGSYQWVDLYGEGLSGILTEQAGCWYYKRNLGGGKFGASLPLPTKPSLASTGSALQLSDVDGDGDLELVVRGQFGSGTYSFEEGRWGNFRAFLKNPNIDFNDPNVKVLDLTGDGRGDILVTDSEVITWYQCAGLAGFEAGRQERIPWDEERGPRVIFSEPVQTIFLADMNGDGLTDIVRIRNGEVCYWPNLGYGRFGAKVRMSNAPLFDFSGSFNPKYLKLADIDGSGTTDLFYFGGGHTRFWLNQSGNSFDDGHALAFPKVDSFTTVDVVDLLGKGTSCVVWSTQLPGYGGTQMSYVDLMKEGKPHLLKQVDNGMGKVTNLQYAPSTEFYLADLAAGRPWVTKLPFPMHVLKRVETLDMVGGTRHHETYAYHHGYFDPEEREFRGFGRVETLDTEAFETYSATPQENYVSPVRTVSWFHCGAHLEQAGISAQYADEYYRGANDESRDRLADTVFEDTTGWTAKDFKEAHRALKGRTLRQEVYEDGVDTPYTVTESNFVVKRLQGATAKRNGVFAVNPRESIVWHYEQDDEDPRIVHELTLDVDEYGNELKKATVFYPRQDDPARPWEEEEVNVADQLKLVVLCTKNSFINNDFDPDNTFYRVGVPESARTFEIGGLVPPADGQIYAFGELGTQVATALNNIVAFDVAVDPNTATLQTPTANGRQARLLSWEKYLYWNTGRTAAMTTGCAAHALLHNVDTAVMTNDMGTVATGITESTPLMNALSNAGYVNGTATTGYWWNPGITQHYLDAAGFFLPDVTTDPFGAEVVVDWDTYLLAPQSVTDDLENLTSVVTDYRTMMPMSLTDPNETVTEAITDELGMVIATSIRGTEDNATRGDTAISQYQVQESCSVSAVVANPHTYLQGATTFFYYDLDAWNDRAEPVQAISVVRETFESDLAENQVTTCQIKLTYSDGMGREIQSKLKVDPGTAWVKQQDNSFVETSSNPRWLVTGRTVFNNKQKPVKQYEPFYSASHQYEPEEFFATYGVTPVIHYDPMLRVIRTDSPKGFYSKVDFSPWEVWSFDFNDTVEDSDYREWASVSANNASDDEIYALDQASLHYDTPKVTLLDSLGREFRVLEVHREFEPVDPQNPEAPRDYQDYWFVTSTVFDITGKPLTVTDPRQNELNAGRAEANRISTFAYTYDMTQSVIRTVSIDSGDRRVLTNVMGKPVRTVDSKGSVVEMTYDALQRMTSKTVTGNGLDNVVELLIYGESVTDAADFNLRGQLYRQYDSSGRVTMPLYDIMGKPRQMVKELRSDYKTEADWPNTEAAREELLETEAFTTETFCDALGRVVLQKQPDGLNGTTCSEVSPEYLPSGWLKSVSVKMRNETAQTTFVDSITYNPKGQRKQITYGNGTVTAYTYEPKTFRLTGLLTTRTSDSKVLQDISYIYDPVGNILKIRDDSYDQVFNNNQLVAAESVYTYDSLYRLVEANGRQHNALAANHDVGGAFKQSAYINDITALTNYTQFFTYDEAGNLTKLVHDVPAYSAACYTRHIDVDTASNRALQRPDVGDTVFTGKFDANGNQVVFAHLNGLAWNFRDNISKATIIPREDFSDDAEWYVYDASGQRVRKVREALGFAGSVLEVEEKIYLGAVEIKRFRRETTVDNVTTITYLLDRSSLHVMDDKSRIALVNYWDFDGEWREVTSSGQLDQNRVRYQYGNHLGSASLEVDAAGLVISYEEYFPYGGTAFMTGSSQTEVKLKEYRYSGKERDDSTAFYYYGARYYAPWICRWCSPDPAGPVDGPDLYLFVKNNPMRLMDKTGNAGKEHGLINSVKAFFNNEVAPRLEGAADVVVGLAAVAAGAEACVNGAPEVGVPVIAAGIDYGSAGVGQVFTGEKQQSAAEKLFGPIGKTLEGGVVSGAAFGKEVLAATKSLANMASGAAKQLFGKAPQEIRAAASAASSTGEAGTLVKTAKAGENAVKPGGTADLEARAQQIHEVLAPIAQKQRTTAVLRTNGGDIVAGGGRDLTPAQRAMLVPGETAAKLPGAHAEVTAISNAQKAGVTPEAIATTRTICPKCVEAIEASGGTITSPTTAEWTK